MYDSWEDLMQNEDKDFLNTEMKFSSMDKGVMHYFGDFDGKKVYCAVSEDCVRNYDYSAVETVSSVTQGCYVFLTINGEELLITH